VFFCFFFKRCPVSLLQDITSQYRGLLPRSVSQFGRISLTFSPKSTSHSRDPWLPGRRSSWYNSYSAPLLLSRSEQHRKKELKSVSAFHMQGQSKEDATFQGQYDGGFSRCGEAGYKTLVSMVQWSGALPCGRNKHNTLQSKLPILKRRNAGPVQ
jgi:hypothetical protein